MSKHLITNLWVFVSPYRINAVSNGQVRGDSYSEGCLGQTGMLASPWGKLESARN